jgi:hypothetical protein
MKRTMKGWVVLAALASVGASDIAAQDAPEQQQRLRAGPRVEAIMQMRERLELTEQQIADLEVIRRETVQERSAQRAEMDEMRSQLAAGQIRRSEMMAFMEDRRDAARGATDQRRARIEGVLTEAQLEQVQELRTRARAFARGRASVRGSDRPGFRGRPGVRSGDRRGRFGPARMGPRG